MVKGEDVLDALIAGVNIVELDPADDSVGYGGLPNADGVVQLDSCCMHGPKKRAGGVAALEGVRTPSLVAQAVLEQTDHHLLVGKGAQEFARNLGFTVEDDLNTDTLAARSGSSGSGASTPSTTSTPRSGREAEDEARRRMMADGLLDPFHSYGTINCNGVEREGRGLRRDHHERPRLEDPRPCGRLADPRRRSLRRRRGRRRRLHRPGRGQPLQPLVVPHRRKHAPRGIPRTRAWTRSSGSQANTVEKRLLDAKGNPDFHLQFYVLNRTGEYAGVSLYGGKETGTRSAPRRARRRSLRALSRRPSPRD